MKIRICVNCETMLSEDTLVCTNCGLPFKAYRYASTHEIAEIILKGNAHYDKEDYENAFNCYKIACDHGDPIAFMKLGDCFRIAFHQQRVNYIRNDALISEYGRKAFDLYRLSCKKIPKWSENHNRYLYMKVHIELLPKFEINNIMHDDIEKIQEASCRICDSRIPSNLDNMGFDPFYQAIELTLDNFLNDALVSILDDIDRHPIKIDYSCYKKIIQHPHTEKDLQQDLSTNIEKHYWRSETAFFVHSERMRELEEEFAEEDAEEYIQQWEIEQDDSMLHSSDYDDYYNSYYNDDYDGNDDDY